MRDPFEKIGKALLDYGSARDTAEGLAALRVAQTEWRALRGVLFMLERSVSLGWDNGRAETALERARGLLKRTDRQPGRDVVGVSIDDHCYHWGECAAFDAGDARITRDEATSERLTCYACLEDLA